MCAQLTDAGVRALLRAGAGGLRSLDVSRCPALTDRIFDPLAKVRGPHDHLCVVVC